MADVVADFSMTLDGFVAGPNDDVQHVFSWMRRTQPSPSPAAEPAASPDSGNPSAVHSGRITAADADDIGRDSPAGALVCGRGLFDLAQGWGADIPSAPTCMSSRTTHPPTGLTPNGSPS